MSGLRILFVTSEAQWDGAGGGVTHTRGVLALLEMISWVTLRRLVLPLPLRRAPRELRRLRAMAASIGSAGPARSHYLLHAGARRRLRAALAAEAFDAVILNDADLLPLADELAPSQRCVLVSHNVAADVAREDATARRVPPGLRRLLRRNVEKTLRMERAGVRHMDLVLAISEADAEQYRRLSPEVPVRVVSAAFAYPPYDGARPAPGRPLQVAYIAKLSWRPNLEAARWFADAVLPQLPGGVLQAHYFGPGSEAFDGRHPALRGHGLVQSLSAVWRGVSFTLCPILSGTGINIKLAESLYNRVPVLATPHACRGLAPFDDPAVAVVPPEEWPTFLASERALALAAASVRNATAERFAAGHAVVGLADALSRLLAACAVERPAV